jgi:type II secretory pathway component PulF
MRPLPKPDAGSWPEHATSLRQSSDQGIAQTLQLPQTTSTRPSLLGGGGRVHIKHVLGMTEQLLTLLNAGLPLDRALHITISSIENTKFRSVMQAVVVDVEKGQTLADAFSRHSDVFPRLYVNMVRAGEEGGVLKVVMERLVEFYTRSIEFRSFMITSSIYPIILFIFGASALLGLTIFVLPKFGQIFNDMNQSLPLPAAFLIGIGEFLKSYGIFIIGFVSSAIISFVYALRNEKWRERWQLSLLKIPIIGVLILKIQLAHICRTWGTLLSSGVPILTAMRIVKELTDHIPLRNALDRLVRAVQEGRGISGPVRADPFFPKLLGQLTTVGEESGALDNMLIRVADQYEKDIEKATRNLVALFEPIMILVMGSLIGGIVISMLTAIFSINDMPL